MFQDNVIKLAQPGEFCDALTEVLRQGARTLFAQAVEAEVARIYQNHSVARSRRSRRDPLRRAHRLGTHCARAAWTRRERDAR